MGLQDPWVTLTYKNEVPCCKGMLMKNSQSNGNITAGELYWRFLGQWGLDC